MIVVRGLMDRVQELEEALQRIIDLVEPLGEDCSPEALAEIAELALSKSSEDVVTISLGLDPDDGWSVIPKERQEALIEDLRTYARRRIAVEGNRAQFSRPLSELPRPPWYGKDIVSVSIDDDFEVGEGFVFNLGKLPDEVETSLNE